jgi:hypothetical protein
MKEQELDKNELIAKYMSLKRTYAKVRNNYDELRIQMFFLKRQLLTIYNNIKIMDGVNYNANYDLKTQTIFLKQELLRIYNNIIIKSNRYCKVEYVEEKRKRNAN